MTAQTGLRLRYDRLLKEKADIFEAERDLETTSATAGEENPTSRCLNGTFDEPQEMLGWWSLPATIQVIRTAVDSKAEWCNLLVLDEAGAWLWDESINLPSDWREGSLFVVRRVS